LTQNWLEAIAVERGLNVSSVATVDEFWQLVVARYTNDRENPDTSNDAKLAVFCQALAQLAQVINTFKMNEVDLSFVVNSPNKIENSLTKVDLVYNNLQFLSYFKAWQNSLGARADEGLKLLHDDDLTSEQLASMLDTSEYEVSAAWDILGITGGEPLLSAIQGYHTNAWLQASAHMAVGVDVLHQFLSLPYDETSSQWNETANNLLSSTPEAKVIETYGYIDEQLSKALCAYYLSNIASTITGGDEPITDRDDIYQYLLIDNLVSHEVTTSRIAEAMASVQLYINRCLNGMEPNANKDLFLEQFFVDWQPYNKRYSTWAGVSMLAYYPENYLEPTLRYNQTSLQQQLLTEVSQSKLTPDSVEASYLNYLNGFEDIANLKVLCSYHHAPVLDDGKSYFIGRTYTSPFKYYCRSLNRAMMDSDGKYVASAWTDWEEIVAPISAINDEVRPVIFNNRLYIAWQEWESEPDAS
ncbi:neuraminidase-like domain-containing protein, partial [Zooshikella sp. RANM57]|uniref:neuraminidase-like domain-containing protein n=1 Tax=Zooshikella sp. RANM57 TaxID=3425863 RepID=UPI003D6F8B68